MFPLRAHLSHSRCHASALDRVIFHASGAVGVNRS